MREPFYRATYHRNDWRLADAFSPQPGTGRRVFRVSVAALDEHTEQQILAALHETAPNGHRLTSLEIYPAEGPERVIWSTPPGQRFNAQGGTPHG